MSDKAKLLALAEAVEKLTGPDRAYDGMIAKAVGAHPCWATVQKDRQPELFTDGEVGLRAREWLAPKYTGSLDAAMTLVPRGFMWRLQSWPDGVNTAILEKNAGDFGAIDARHTETFAATPALALCAAALRAQAEALS